jgi:hypothetical protein
MPIGRLSNLTGPSYSVTMATMKPKNAIAGPFLSRDAAQGFIDKTQQGGTINLPDLNPLSWLSSLGGDIGSGIEGGIIQVIKDLWTVVIGPLEVLLGVLIGMWVLVIYFRHDIMNVTRMVAGVAAAAA